MYKLIENLISYDNQLCRNLKTAWRASTQTTPTVKISTFSDLLTFLSRKVSFFIWDRIQQNLIYSQNYNCEVCADNHYKVRRKPECYTNNNHTNNDKFRDVLYTESLTSCTCNELIYMGLPCRHIICALISIQQATTEVIFGFIQTFWILDQAQGSSMSPLKVALLPQPLANQCSSVETAEAKGKRLREWQELVNNSEFIEKITATDEGFKIACKLIRNLTEAPFTIVDRPNYYLEK